MASLLDLPDEILLQVLVHLRPIELARLAPVCQRLACLVRENWIWQLQCRHHGFHALSGYRVDRAGESFRGSAQLQQVVLYNSDTMTAPWVAAAVDYVVGMPLPYALALAAHAHFAGSVIVCVAAPVACRNMQRRAASIARQARQEVLFEVEDIPAGRLGFHVVTEVAAFAALQPSVFAEVAQLVEPDEAERDLDRMRPDHTRYIRELNQNDRWKRAPARVARAFKRDFLIRKHILADRDRARASARSKDAVTSSDRTLAAVVISPRQYRYARDRLASGDGGGGRGSARAGPRDRWVFAQSAEQARRDNAVTRAALHDSLLTGMVAAVEDDAVTILDLDERADDEETD